MVKWTRVSYVYLSKEENFSKLRLLHCTKARHFARRWQDADLFGGWGQVPQHDDTGCKQHNDILLRTSVRETLLLDFGYPHAAADSAWRQNIMQQVSGKLENYPLYYLKTAWIWQPIILCRKESNVYLDEHTQSLYCLLSVWLGTVNPASDISRSMYTLQVWARAAKCECVRRSCFWICVTSLKGFPDAVCKSIVISLAVKSNFSTLQKSDYCPKLVVAHVMPLFIVLLLCPTAVTQPL